MRIETAGYDTGILLEQHEIQPVIACLNVAIDGAPDDIREIVLPILEALEQRWEQLRNM